MRDFVWISPLVNLDVGFSEQHLDVSPFERGVRRTPTCRALHLIVGFVIPLC